MQDLLCFAHRGASGHEPENTLRAVHKALALGSPWLEVDVHLVQDRVVVIHDSRLERTTNGKGRVAKSSLNYLRSLDAGQGEKIPFLEEVLDLCCGAAGLNIELKGGGTAAPVAAILSDRVQRGICQLDQLLVSSFHLLQLLKFKRLAPEIPRGVLVTHTSLPYLGIASQLQAHSVHVKLEHLSGKFVTRAHARGLRVYVFTVNSATDLERVRHLGADGVFTDYPELLL
jgi:glycerophosphoryl diester phosphodiesterase